MEYSFQDVREHVASVAVQMMEARNDGGALVLPPAPPGKCICSSRSPQRLTASVSTTCAPPIDAYITFEQHHWTSVNTLLSQLPPQ